MSVPHLFSKPCNLAAEWRGLLYMALELARQISGLARSDPRAALEKTEMLETWCLMALAQVSRQFDEEPPEVRARKPYSEHLPPIAAILQMLLVVTARVKAGLRARLAARAYAPARPAPLRVITQLRAAPEYIDTS